MMAIFAQNRIDMFAEVLLAAGWATDPKGGWFPPVGMRTEIARQYGSGHLHIWDATNAQLRFDHFILHRDDTGAVPA